MDDQNQFIDGVRTARRHFNPGAFPENPVTRKLRKEGWFEHNGKRYDTAHRVADVVCDLMAGLVVTGRRKRGLEIGTLFGYSTLHLAEAFAATEGSLVTVDLRLPKRTWRDGQEIENVHEVAERLVEDAGFGRIVTFKAGNSNAVLPEFIMEGRTFDFAFIDGSHVFQVVTLDFLCVDLLLEPGGLIVLDDISANIGTKENTNGGPNRLLPSIYASGRFDTLPLSANHMVLRKR